MRGLSDTSPEAERVWIETFQAMPPSRKGRLLEGLLRQGRALHAIGYRLRHSNATEADIQADWIQCQSGTIPGGFGREGYAMNESIDPVSVVREVFAVFKNMGLAHALGGSMASSIHGVPRYTSDADVTVAPFAGREAEFTGHFGPEYYLSIDAIRQANRDRASFNIIHTIIGFKVDVFIQKRRPFDASLLQRRIPDPTALTPDDAINLLTAEDIVLHKLEWYRLGDEASDRQWNDVLNVMKVQAARLDRGYMEHWADELRVRDLLDRALAEAGL